MYSNLTVNTLLQKLNNIRDNVSEVEYMGYSFNGRMRGEIVSCSTNILHELDTLIEYVQQNGCGYKSEGWLWNSNL